MKKNIPLNVLETLEKFVRLQGDEFIVLEPKEFLVRVKDNDEESAFYFNIEDYKNDKGLKLLIDWSPINKESIGNRKMWIDAKQLDEYFNNWTNLLKRYITVNSFYDDPILKSFVDSYYAEFEIVDEKADVEPLKPNQILLLDEHLEYIEQNIEKYQNDSNEEIIQEIKQDVVNLRESLTKKSKAWVIKNLSTIWGKMTKQGTKFLKEFVSESKKQAIKEGVKYLIQQGADLIN
jgi:hypothetical protein